MSNYRCEHCGVETDGTYFINTKDNLCEPCYLAHLEKFEERIAGIMQEFKFGVRSNDIVDDLSIRLDRFS